MAESNFRAPYMDTHLLYEVKVVSKEVLARCVTALVEADTCFAVVGGELRIRFHDRGIQVVSGVLDG